MKRQVQTPQQSLSWSVYKLDCFLQVQNSAKPKFVTDDFKRRWAARPFESGRAAPKIKQTTVQNVAISGVQSICLDQTPAPELFVQIWCWPQKNPATTPL